MIFFHRKVMWAFVLKICGFVQLRVCEWKNTTVNAVC